MHRLRMFAAAVTAVLLILPFQSASSAEAARDGWHLVRFGGRITQADRDALEAAGARALQYAPRDAYLAWFAADDVGAVRALPEVSSVRTLDAAEKLDPAASGELLTALVYGPRLGGSLLVLEGIGTLVRAVPGQPDSLLQEVVLRGGSSVARRVASLASVLYVGPASPGLQPEDEGSDQIIAGNVQGNTPQTGYGAWLAEKGIDGSGVRVSIVDTGLDDRHPDLENRVVAKVDYTPSGEPSDLGGHGTHVAGIVGGNASALSEVGGVQDSNGLFYGLGMAPSVEFVSQNAIARTMSSGWPPSYGWDRLSRDAVRNGSIAWNASWHSGEGTNAGYIASARTMDIMARDADWETAGAEGFTMVFSAGNGGGSTNTITSPKEAKNIIAVGSSRNFRAGSINTISSFSSKGPAVDGRILPTIAAPGESVVSARALPAGSSCTTPVADGFGFYASCSGTSMAAPHVTGSVALIAQWWKERNDGAVPSPAMNKALLVSSATDMGTADIPNRFEGWGRVNLGTLFDESAELITVDQSVVLTEPGAGHELLVEPVDPSRPLKATLAWTDAPGAPGANPALVNDLDLRVVAADGTTWHGNAFSGGRSVAGGTPDRLNNVENVFLHGASGHYTVTVDAWNLPGDGVPFSGDETDQDFALVVSNARVVPPPA